MCTNFVCVFSSDSESESEGDQYVSPKKKQKPLPVVRKFRNDWKSVDRYKNWLANVPGNDTVFKCVPCGSIHGIKGGRSELDTHAKSAKHQKNMNAIQGTASVHQMLIKLSDSKQGNHLKNVQCSEIKLAIFMAEHNIAISVIDDLLPLIKEIGKDPAVVKDMSLGRTKCSKILQNVVAKVESDSLSNILKTTKFSILVDESTDISSDKYLCVLVRYKKNKFMLWIINTFLF